MSRTIKDIYNAAVAERNKRLELSEFKSDSKMSVMNGILWVVAAVIYSFETLLDVFAVDITEAINGRINGTPNYYANALLQYQQGDELIVREDGLAFGYAAVDETKRIITQVSYVSIFYTAISSRTNCADTRPLYSFSFSLPNIFILALIFPSSSKKSPTGVPDKLNPTNDTLVPLLVATVPRKCAPLPMVDT